MNRRAFVTGLSSVCSLVMLPGGLESSEHKSALEQRIRSQMDLGIRNGLTVGAVMMVVQRNKVLGFLGGQDGTFPEDSATTEGARRYSVLDILHQ